MKNREAFSKIKILTIDDEAAIRRSIAMILKARGYLVTEAGSVAEGMTALSKSTFQVVLTDLRMDDGSGLEIIRKIKSDYLETETILLTGFGSIDNAVEAMQAGATDYVTKPFPSEELLLKVDKVIERQKMKKELHSLRQHVAMNYGFDNIVGISKEITKLKETAVRIAPTDITVLITGPSGTGKELFAHAIHYHSNRRAGRFVAIDCSSIPEPLIESELFGHKKGSFTSAHRDKIGLFEEAHGGTLFLDEVSNIPKSVQVKLLRFLQDSEVRPVGAQESKKVDVRIVAATNRELGGMVAAGEFRDDLYYRLSVIPLNLPPLTERAEDVEMLIDYFLRRISNELGKGEFSITRQAVERMISHNWPGNVRELENTLKRGAALCTSTALDTDDIMFISGESPARTDQLRPTKSTLILKSGLLDNNQRTLIIRALNDNNWNYTRTASELGIGRTTLWRKIKRYDLKKELLEVE